MKNKITTILILLLTIISNVGIANTELQLKDKFLCKRIHIDENINVEKVNKKIDFLIFYNVIVILNISHSIKGIKNAKFLLW